MKQGLEVKKLGEICDFQGGSQPPKSNFIYEPRKGYVRFLQIRDFASDKNITYIPDSPKNRHCNEDDILLGRYGASVGKVLINKAGAYNVAVMKTIPNEVIFSKKFLYLYLLSEDFQKRLAKVSSRSAQDGFSKDDIFDFPVLLPTLQEQQNIVSILDEAFANISKAKDNAEQNLKNAKELFESYLQSVFENKNWLEKTVEECVKDGLLSKPLDGNHGEVHPHSKDYVPAGVPFVMACDMKDGQVDQENCKFITEKQAKSLRTGFAINGDVLLSHKGTIGRVSVLETDKPFVILTPQITFYRIKDFEKIFNKFLYYYFLSPSFQKELNQIAGAGSTRAYIGITRQLSLKLKIAPVTEQKIIVKKLEALSMETKKLEAIYGQKLNELEELKKSILQKAFNGEL